MGMRCCTELREAKKVIWEDKGLFSAEVKMLGTLGSVLPVLETLVLRFQSLCPGGLQLLAEGLGAGALPAVTWLEIIGEHVTDASASALAAALGRGAMPRLKYLFLTNTEVGDAGLVALAPALRRLPALESLCFIGSPFGDVGLTALVAAPPFFYPPQTKTDVLKKLQELCVQEAGGARLLAHTDHRRRLRRSSFCADQRRPAGARHRRCRRHTYQCRREGCRERGTRR